MATKVLFNLLSFYFTIGLVRCKCILTGDLPIATTLNQSYSVSDQRSTLIALTTPSLVPAECQIIFVGTHAHYVNC